MLKKVLLILSSFLGLLSFETQGMTVIQPEPQICPDAAAIRSLGVSHNAIQDSDRLWFTGRSNQKYGTKNNWTFIIGKIAASSVSDAYNKALLGLSSLSFQLGPVMAPLSKWVCYYNTAQGYTAVSIYPSIAQNSERLFLNK